MTTTELNEFQRCILCSIFMETVHSFHENIRNVAKYIKFMACSAELLPLHQVFFFQSQKVCDRSKPDINELIRKFAEKIHTWN